MNNQRRKELEGAAKKLEEAREILDSVSQEEEDAYDTLPESFQDGEKGETMKSNIEAINDVSSDIEDLETSIYDIIQGDV